MSDEQDYINGTRAELLALLGYCLDRLGRNTPEWDHGHLLLEREWAIQTLRQICEHHGDNDWDDDLHLVDILGNHLQNYLEARRG